MKELCRKALITALALAACLPAPAQRSRIYSTAEGLPGSRITEICQDRTGFIWIAGEDGLSRFDGREFQTMQPGGPGSGSIAGSQALSMLEDSHGRLWVGTAAGLQTFDPDEGIFKTVSSEYTSTIIEYTPGKGGGSEIWAGGGRHGILIADPLTGKTDSTRTAMISSALPSLQVNVLFPDSGGRIWAAFSQGGFCVIDGAAGAVTDITLPNSVPAGVHVNCFYEDPENGSILIGSQDAGLLIQEKPGEAVRRSSAPQTRDASISAIINDKLFSTGGGFILGTDGHGLLLYDLGQDDIYDFDRSILPGGAGKWKVGSLMFDSQGNLWAGAYLSGVAVIPRRTYGFSRISIANCVTALSTDSQGNLWAGSSSKGLLRINGNGKRTAYDSSNSILPDGIVTALETDRYGNLWIGTSEGLYVKGAAGIRRFAQEGLTAECRITDLEYDSGRDRLYAGTLGGGMLIISPSDLTVTGTAGEDLPISALHIDNDGTVWAGIQGGLLRYDPLMNRSSKDSLSAGSAATILCIYENSDGDMWAGTSDGLFQFKRNAESSRRYSTSDGLPCNVICSILEDGDGNLWISTTRGLCKYTPSESRFSCYSEDDGTKDNEFAYRAACETEDGRLIFGSTTGLTIFRPEDIVEPDGGAAPVILTELAAGNDKIGDISLVPSAKIKIPGGLDSFTAGFSVLEYTSPDKIICFYKLEGLDKDWISIPAGKREISRERLPEGRYTLRIRAGSANMPARFSECAVPLRIKAPWYRRWWAYFIGCLTAVCALWLLFLDFSSRRALRRRVKESGVKDLKLRMVSDLSEAIRTPMTLVMSPLQELREQEKDPEKKDLYNMMCRNCQRIIRSLNQMSDLHRLDSGELEFHFRKTDIVYFIKDILRSFSGSAQSRHISLDFSSEQPELHLWIDQGHFDKIIFNLLSSALKHTPDYGHIRVTAGTPSEDGKVTVSIFHSCIMPCDLGKLFSRGDDGPGLYLARSLTTLQHGELSAANVDGGVMFFLTLPCGCDHLTASELSPTERHKELYTRYSDSHEEAAVTKDEDERDHKSRKTIVVAGFDSDIRNYLKSSLRRQYNIRTCADSRNAWGIISTTIPDAVITGLDSAGASSLELCSKIKHNPGTNHIPVIILSTSDDEESAEESTRTGADLYLRLPVSIERLRGSLANAISAREAIRSKYTNEIHCDYDRIKLEGKAGGNFIDEVISIIHSNIGNPDFTVADLSREAGISRVHLNRKLKDALNISPGNLIKSIKMRHAAYLLINNDASIADISGSTGFSSPSYFTSSFRDYFGMTPKEFLGKYRGCTDPDTLDKLLGSDWRQV